MVSANATAIRCDRRPFDTAAAAARAPQVQTVSPAQESSCTTTRSSSAMRRATWSITVNAAAAFSFVSHAVIRVIGPNTDIVNVWSS